MGRSSDLTGRTFGRLLVAAQAPHTKDGKKQWKCVCACGASAIVRGAELTRSRKPVRSCGCLRRDVITTHGMAGSETYRIWRGMLNRCYNKKMQTYPNYGGRGIQVCAQWHDFENFYADMGARPPNKTLDRKNNDGDYTPDNCQWATLKEQGRNQSTNVVLCVGNLAMPLSAWTEALGCAKGTVRERLQRGWPVEAACTLPVRALHIAEE